MEDQQRGIEHLYQVGQADGEVIGIIVQQPLRSLRSGLRQGHQGTCVERTGLLQSMPARFLTQPAQAGHRLPAPAQAAATAHAVEHDRGVAQLAGLAPIAAVHHTVEDQTDAEAVARLDGCERGRASSLPKPLLAQRLGPGVVVDEDAPAEALAD